MRTAVSPSEAVRPSAVTMMPPAVKNVAVATIAMCRKRSLIPIPNVLPPLSASTSRPAQDAGENQRPKGGERDLDNRGNDEGEPDRGPGKGRTPARPDEGLRRDQDEDPEGRPHEHEEPRDAEGEQEQEQ